MTIKELLQKINHNKEIIVYLKEYKISSEYLSTSKKMISRGIFIGFFIALTPMPMQMLAVLAFTLIGKFNVPIALSLCWLTNPITMPIVYYIEYLTGSFFLGIEPLSVDISIKWFNSHIKDILIPLYTGSLFYSILISTMGYQAIYYYWKIIALKKRYPKK